MVRIVTLLLTVLTGFTGLVYEVAWQKALATLLGSHSEATAAVLGIFLGGLSLGYALFGAVTRRVVGRAERRGRRPRLLLLYGAVEAGIGVHALAFMHLFAAVQAISHGIPLGSHGAAFGVDVALTALLIGPPTVLMGGTIPILTQALARSLDDSTRIHARIYGINTAGAFAGALAAGFFLIPWYGIPAVLQTMGLLNLGVGAAFAVMGLWHRALAAAPGRAAARAVQGFALYAAVAVLLGFAMMSVQTVLIRIGGLAFGASGFTFSMVVAVFVLCIALGSLLVSAFASLPRGMLALCAWGLIALLLALYPVLPDATYYAYALRTFFRDENASFYPYYLSGFLGVLVILAVPVGLSGAMLPLLFHRLRREVGELGSVAGRLYSWNTVGNLLGALLGGYALLFWLDLHHVYRLALAALVAVAASVTVLAYGLRLRWAPALLVVPWVALALLPSWSPLRLSAGLFRFQEANEMSYEGPDAVFGTLPQGLVIFYDDGPTASVAVHQQRPADRRFRSIVNNGKSDGSLMVDYRTMGLAALIPCLIADDCERAFVIGYGTGVTAGELASLDSTREVVVSEISPAVVEAAPLFDHGNRQASKSPRVEIVQQDAYRGLLRSEGAYDVIVSEPSNPWMTGVEMLYSREFLTAARERLRPGGVYAQWFHTYETDEETIELVLRTYADVFDHVSVWYTMTNDLLLLGLQQPEGLQDLGRIERRLAQPDFEEGLERCGIGSLAELLAHEVLPLGVVQAALPPGDEEVHTLFHPRLSYRAARAFFRGQSADLPPTQTLAASRAGVRNSLLRRYQMRVGGTLSEEEREAVGHELCAPGAFREGAPCAVVMAHWLASDGSDPVLSELLERYRQRPVFEEQLDLDLLSRLAAFYEENASGSPGAISFGQAQEVTELFRRYYHHAYPFRREVLAGIWQHCRDPQGRCSVGAARVQKELGSLRARVALDAPEPSPEPVPEPPGDVAAPPEKRAELGG